jgi:hypothetical protein
VLTPFPAAQNLLQSRLACCDVVGLLRVVDSIPAIDISNSGVRSVKQPAQVCLKVGVLSRQST